MYQAPEQSLGSTLLSSLICFTDVPGSPILTPPSTNLTSSAAISWSQHPVYVTSYSVSWTYSGPCTGALGLDGTDVLSDGTTRSYTVMNLEPNSEYLVQVIATNNAGSSSAGQVVVYTAFDGKYKINGYA